MNNMDTTTKKTIENSKSIYADAIKLIPGGVNSPVRAFQSVNRDFPIFIKKAKGSYVYDEDDNKYIDLIGSWGPMILGHGNEELLTEIRKTIENGISYGLPSKGEVEFAELINHCFPSMEMIRLTSSGTESTMSAVRLARAYTKRNKILKFNGCYHGHSDSLLVSAGSGLLTSSLQDSNGITLDNLKDTLNCEFGDIKAVKDILNTREVACLIVEPIPANMGLIVPRKEFLQQLRDVCTETSTVLIFDEVISGFRVSLGGAQEYFGITPDLTTLGKIIGGGFPIGAFGGKADIMRMLAPIGDVYHAGTLSGNQVSVAAGYTTVNYLKNNKSEVYKDLESKTTYMAEEIRRIATKHNVPVVVNSINSLYTIFFTESKEVNALQDSVDSSEDKYITYFNTMLEEGIIVPPSKFEAHFLSYVHTKEELDTVLAAIDKAFCKISKNEK